MSDSQIVAIWRRTPLLLAYLAAVAIGGIVQAAFGSNPGVVVLAVGAIMISAIPALFFGIRDMPSLLSLAVAARYAASAIAWRTISFKRLDLDLYNPVLSFEIILYACTAISVAALLSHLLFPRRPFFREEYAPAGLELLMAAGAIAGVFALAVAYRATETLGGIQALASTGLTLLPLVWMHYNVTNGRPIFSPGLIMLLLVLSAAALGTNSRQGLLQPIEATASYIICFRIKVSRTAIISGALLVAFCVLFVSPLMLSVRGMRNIVSPAEVLAYTISSAETGQTLQRYEALQKVLNNGPYAMHYTTGGGELTQRMVNVEQMDVLVDRANQFGPIGSTRFWEGLTELLPSFLVPDKSVIKAPSFAFWAYGMIPWGAESNPTPTTFGDAYSIGGIEFVVESAFVIYLLYFLFFRMFCPRFENSLFAIFVFGTYIFTMTVHTVLGMLAVLFRELPFELGLFWLASHVHERFFALSNRSSSRVQ